MDIINPDSPGRLKEIRLLLSNYDFNFNFEHISNNLLEGIIMGPPDTPYEGGVFYIDINIILNQYMPTDYELETADINGDSDININDIIIIVTRFIDFQ